MVLKIHTPYETTSIPSTTATTANLRTSVIFLQPRVAVAVVNVGNGSVMVIVDPGGALVIGGCRVESVLTVELPERLELDFRVVDAVILAPPTSVTGTSNADVGTVSMTVVVVLVPT